VPVTNLGSPVTDLGVPATNMGGPATNLEALATCLEAPRITVEQSGKHNIFGNAAGVTGNHSYYLSFNDIYNSHIQFVFSSMYLCIYIATHLPRVKYLNWLQAVLESNSR
jgi:hypothetical protein